MKRSLILLLFFASHFLFAQQDMLSPEDVAKIEQVTGAVISNDGQKIAYQLVVPVNPTEKNAAASVHLYVYDVATQQSTPYETSQNAGNLKFRPQHNSITFTTKKETDSTTAVYEIPAGGGEASKIFEFDASISSYDWHPDGTQLAFVSSDSDQKDDMGLPYRPEIYETDLATSKVYVASMDDTAPKPLDVKGHVVGVQWNPNGDKLAVSAAPSSLVDDFYTSQRIYMVDAKTLKVTSEIDHKAKLGTMKWSPDGKRIAFIAGGDENDPIDGRIFIAEAKGGSPQVLQQDFQGMFHSIFWKDNNTLNFLASEGVYSSIGSLQVNGNMTRIYEDRNVSISDFSMSDDNTMAFVGSTSQHPSELFLLNSGAASAERITESNPWLKDEKLGKQEVITYKAKDGLELQGILIHPVNASGKSPLITVVHGGPEAHYDNGWLTAYSMPGQVAAGQGYAVFYPNYRGSTGRGIEFAKSSQADPAGKEFDDIIDGIDYLVANNNVDTDKVGVTGGSYGGYATAWMSTRHTDRFAAGVMSVGISNNISKWGTSDIPEEMFLVHSRKRIWDDYQFYLERSPIFYAGQANTPLLIMHGKEDTRVDPGQSYELYRHIKTRTDTPVRLVLYPGEGHGNRKSTARYDFNLRMMRWFNTYLKNETAEIPETRLQVEMDR